MDNHNICLYIRFIRFRLTLISFLIFRISRVCFAHCWLYRCSYCELTLVELLCIKKCIPADELYGCVWRTVSIAMKDGSVPASHRALVPRPTSHIPQLFVKHGNGRTQIVRAGPPATIRPRRPDRGRSGAICVDRAGRGFQRRRRERACPSLGGGSRERCRAQVRSRLRRYPHPLERAGRRHPPGVGEVSSEPRRGAQRCLPQNAEVCRAIQHHDESRKGSSGACRRIGQSTGVSVARLGFTAGANAVWLTSFVF